MVHIDRSVVCCRGNAKWGISLLLVEYCRMRLPRQQGPLSDVVKARELLRADMNSNNSRTSCQAVCVCVCVFLFSSQTQKESEAILYRRFYWMWLRNDWHVKNPHLYTPVATLSFFPLMLRKFNFIYWLSRHVCCYPVCCNSNTWAPTVAVHTQTGHLTVSIRRLLDNTASTVYRGSTVVKLLCYKSEGHWFDPSCCQWIFHSYKTLPIALWSWGRLSL